jgi:hypothetical protein
VGVCAPFIGPGREWGRRAVAGGGGNNADRFGSERKRGVVGRGGDSVGEVEQLVRLPWRTKDGGREAGTAACDGARPGWRLGPA